MGCCGSRPLTSVDENGEEGLRANACERTRRQEKRRRPQKRGRSAAALASCCFWFRSKRPTTDDTDIADDSDIHQVDGGSDLSLNGTAVGSEERLRQDEAAKQQSAECKKAQQQDLRKLKEDERLKEEERPQHREILQVETQQQEAERENIRQTHKELQTVGQGTAGLLTAVAQESTEIFNFPPITFSKTVVNGGNSTTILVSSPCSIDVEVSTPHVDTDALPASVDSLSLQCEDILLNSFSAVDTPPALGSTSNSLLTVKAAANASSVTEQPLASRSSRPAEAGHASRTQPEADQTSIVQTRVTEISSQSEAEDIDTCTSHTSYGLKRVIVSEKLVENFVQAALQNTQNNIETCGILCGKQSREVLYITHVILPKQRGTPDSCMSLKEEDLFDYQVQHDLISLGWIHTHPSQTSFLSSVDLHTQCSYQLMMNEAIAIVCAPKYKQTGIFSLTRPYGLQYIADCSEAGFHPHPEEPPLYEAAKHVTMDESLSSTIYDLR